MAGKKIAKYIKIGTYEFEKSIQIKDLYNQQCWGENTRYTRKINKANKPSHCYKKVLKSKQRSKGTKIKIYSVRIRPVKVYIADTMTMTTGYERTVKIQTQGIKSNIRDSKNKR